MSQTRLYQSLCSVFSSSIKTAVSGLAVCRVVVLSGLSSAYVLILYCLSTFTQLQNSARSTIHHNNSLKIMFHTIILYILAIYIVWDLNS